MGNELPKTLAVVLADSTLYERAPLGLRERLEARLRDAEAITAAHAPAIELPQAGKDDQRSADPAEGAVNDAGNYAGNYAGNGSGNGAGTQRLPSKPHAGVTRGPRRFFGLLPDRAVGWSFAGGGLAGVALSLLVGLSVLHDLPWLAAISSDNALTRSPSTSIEQEIVASHVRALISTRDMDVLSSDQHTVKPWFNGHIDYAPPVVDPRADGFPLVGGRLDYVGERAVAVMVYRYLKHPIDLYVFPDTADASAASQASDAEHATAMSRQGYSIMTWKHSGMVFWAITDASMPNLKSFVVAVKRMT